MAIDATLERAQAGDDRAFSELTDPYLAELRLHCYRILGSVQDAEDMLQETLLAAWRRPRPEPPEPPFQPTEPTRRGEPVWLEPYPDTLLDGLPGTTPGPDTRYEIKATIALAFAIAMQHLPPLQRAVRLEYQGPAAIADFLTLSARYRGGPTRLITTRANGQPAFGCYVPDEHAGIYHAHGIMVLTLAADRVSAITRFIDSGIIPRFGLPRTLPG